MLGTSDQETRATAHHAGQAAVIIDWQGDEKENFGGEIMAKLELEKLDLQYPCGPRSLTPVVQSCQP